MNKDETLTLAGGCFWCIEAVFSNLKGVSKAVSGYAGGTTPHPSYEAVSTGQTGHAEVVQITFDPAVVTLHDILTIFFTLHNPTALNRQGADVGSQYRSAIFYSNEEQKEAAKRVVQEIADAGIWKDPLVTELTALDIFYEAEPYHQNFFKQHPEQGYCQAIIAPKLAKLRNEYRNKLRGE